MGARTRAWAALLGPLLFAACTCGKKPGTKQVDYSALLAALPQAAVDRPVALLPDKVELVLASSDAKGAWDALMKTGLGQALVQGKAVESAELSNQVEAVLSLSHDVASASSKPLVARELAAAMAGPAALGFTADDHFVLAKAVDPGKESVVRLALMAASVKGAGVSEVDRGGFKLTRVDRGGRSLYLAAFRNAVVASDSPDLAGAAVDLALGKGGKSAEGVADLKAEAAALSGPQALVWSSFDGDSVARAVLGLEQGSARLELGGAPVVKLRGQRVEGAAGAAPRAQAVVPREALAFAGLGALGLDPLSARLAEAGGVKLKAGDVQADLGLPAEVRAAFDGSGFYALLGVENRHFRHLAGLGVKDAAAVRKALPALVRAWGGEEPTEAGAPDALCAQSGHLCLALARDHLVAATSKADLALALQTAAGSHPSLADAKGFAKVGGAGKRVLALYLDTPHAAEAALAFYEDAAKAGRQRFDAADVAETVEPLFNALKPLAPVGGGADADGKGVAGELSALE